MRPTKIRIGYAGEENARSVSLEIGDLLAQWPGAAPQINVMRPGEDDGYQAARVEWDGGDVVVWRFTPYDAAVEGYGVAQIWMTDAEHGVLGMSERMRTEVEKANPRTVEPGEWQQGFLAETAMIAGQALGAAVRAEDALRESLTASGEAAEAMRQAIAAAGSVQALKVQAVTLEPGSPASASYDAATGVLVIGVPGTKDVAEYDDTQLRELIAQVAASVPVAYDDTEVRQLIQGVAQSVPEGVTADNVRQAIGFEPAKESEVSGLKGDLAQKLTEPANAQIGQYFRVASVDEQGHAVLEAVNLPVASSTTKGVVGIKASYGVWMNGGFLSLNMASGDEVGAKKQTGAVLTPANVDHIIRAGLLSNSQITDADKPQICETIGAEQGHGAMETIFKGEITCDNEALVVNFTPCKFACIYVSCKANSTIGYYGVITCYDSNGATSTLTSAEVGALTAQNQAYVFAMKFQRGEPLQFTNRNTVGLNMSWVIRGNGVYSASTSNPIPLDNIAKFATYGVCSGTFNVCVQGIKA